MADLYYCPAIVFESAVFWLPPWVTADITRSQTVQGVNPPQTNQYKHTSVRPNQATKINLTCAGVKPGELTQEAVLRWFEEIWTALSGEDKIFDLFLFSDRAWTGCALESQTERIGLAPLIVLQDTGLSISCESSQPDTSRQLTFTDFNAEYPYASLVGRPLGTAVDPGTVIPVIQPSFQQLPGTFFGGLTGATSAGQEHRFSVGGATGGKWRLESLQIVGADPVDATASTSVRISTAGVGGGGSFITATIAAGERFSVPVTANIEVTTGASLYGFATAGGGHQNVQYIARLRAL